MEYKSFFENIDCANELQVLTLEMKQFIALTRVTPKLSFCLT